MTSALQAAARGAPRSSSRFTPVGWSADPDLPYEEWLRHGSRIGLAARSSGWWLGDWLRYGESRYGTKYTAASRITGYDRQTLMNMVYVTARIDSSRRREKLSFSHHAEVASLDAAEQDRWLGKAEADQWSVRDLRGELQAAQQLGPPRSTALARAGDQKRARRSTSSPARASRIVTCPQCGERFADE
jgi:hypothetical protein